MILDVSIPSLLVALVGGLVAFFSPCLLPLLPAYLGYFGGVSLHSEQTITASTRWRVFRQTAFFTLGFVVVFVVLGLSATGIGGIFLSHRQILLQLGGLLFLLFGLVLLEVFRAPWLYRQLSFRPFVRWQRFANLNALLIGGTFGLAWTPCIGPVLGTILFLASQASTAGHGALLLFLFGVGVAMPFLLLAIFLDHLALWIQRFGRWTRIIQKVTGIVIVLLGILMLANQYTRVASWILHLTKFQPAL